MKKGFVLFLALLMPVAALAGCEDSQGASVPSQVDASSVPEVSSAAPPQSTPDSGYQIEYPDAPPTDAEVTAGVNRVLASYRDGTLPEKIIYHSDANTVTQSPPKDTVLPESVAESDLEFAENGLGKYGYEVTARLALPEDYALEVMVGQGYMYDGQLMTPPVVGVWFTDLRGAASTDAVTIGGIGFANLKADRTHASTDFTGVVLEEASRSGNISWNKSGDFVWIDYGEGFFYTYGIAADGNLVQEYPFPREQDIGSPFTSLSDEEMLAENTALFAAFQQALADSGLPA